MNQLIDILSICPADLAVFHSDPEIIVKYSNQYEKQILLQLEQLSLPSRLHSLPEIAAACIIVYTVSQQTEYAKGDILHNSAKLALTIFDQKESQLPLTFVSAFTEIVSKIASSHTVKTPVSSFLELILKDFSLQMAHDDSSVIFIVNMLMKLVIKHYYILSNDSLSFAVDFLRQQKDITNLIELLSMHFLNVPKAKDVEFCNYCFSNFIEVAETEPDIIDLIGKFVVNLQNSSNSKLAIQLYFTPFLKRFFLEDLHSLISGLIAHGKPQIKVLGIQLFIPFIQSAEASLTQICYITEMMICELSKSKNFQFAIDVLELIYDVFTDDFSLDLGVLQAQMICQKFIQNFLLITLLPLLIFVLTTKLATHKNTVVKLIKIRKEIIEFYGFLLLKEKVVQSLDQLIFSDQLSPELHEEFHIITQILLNFKFMNSQTHSVLELAFNHLQHQLQQSLASFLLQELIFRIQDEGQSIKKTSVGLILQYIKLHPEQIKLLFSDILQIQDQQILAQNIFLDFVIQPILDQNELVVQPLFDFISSCPVKLFESTFAVLLKEQLLPQQVFGNLINFGQKGAYIVLRLCLQYSKQQNQRIYAKVVSQLHGRLVEGGGLYTYILYSLDVSYFMGLIDFDVSQYIQITDVEEAVQQQVDKLKVLQVIEQIDNVSGFLDSLVRELNELISLQRSSFEDDNDTSQYVVKGEVIFNKIVQLIQNQTLSQVQIEKLYKPLEATLMFHPLSAVPVYYLVYFSESIDFRFNAFEKLINSLQNSHVLQQTKKNSISLKIANNLLISIVSCIYGFPDEFGQFFTLIFDADPTQYSHLIQRHILYIAMDLKQLQLIKFDVDIFKNLFKYMSSQNDDLKALSCRLLLQPSMNDFFIKFFRVCAQEIKDVTVKERQNIYQLILSKLSQVNKYNLINQMLGTLPNCDDWEAGDILRMLASGAIEISVSEELERAATVLKKLNFQYTIQSVLPRLMERLGVYNNQQNDSLKELCITSIQQVAKQMKINYEELVGQFGVKYCLELLQIKW
ncbi:hypothetical protein SS50377_21979 [Spironucleus salmonicida]|uniref:Uncharacterized protein n=1 Tax=Spironucleus salmonicida TaxID=348837 RepID=V6LQR5_9EUKA|nr:hypothetical protein SS50377_21979 [Spironucleus salmonicida]|eukprot:EST47017.1 Hypothetical protein SS50377_12973 [Spironucleus salmonicida]